MEHRISQIERVTKETQIRIRLDLDGSGQANIHTGIGFFDHMWNGFARHGLFDLDVEVTGDLEVDCVRRRVRINGEEGNPPLWQSDPSDG